MVDCVRGFLVSALTTCLVTAAACSSDSLGSSRTLMVQDDPALTAAFRQIGHRFVEQSVSEELFHFRTQGELTSFWQRFDPSAPPAIDFGRYDVVLVLMGTRSSGGYLVRILSLTEGRAGRSIEALFCKPPPGATNIAEVTSPFDVKLVAKSDRILGFSKQEGTTGEGACR